MNQMKESIHNVVAADNDEAPKIKNHYFTPNFSTLYRNRVALLSSFTQFHLGTYTFNQTAQQVIQISIIIELIPRRSCVNLQQSHSSKRSINNHSKMVSITAENFSG